MERKMRQDDKMKIMKKLEDGRFLMKVNKIIYDKESVLATVYKFTGTCYVHVDSIEPDHYGVYFSQKNPDIDLISQVDSFSNELIDQQVRQNLERSNKSIKEMIVKKAFFPFQGDDQQ